MIRQNINEASLLHLPASFERQVASRSDRLCSGEESLVARFARKKNKVMKLVEAVSKTGYNEEAGYNFVEEAEVIRLLRAALIKAGLSLSVTTSEVCLINTVSTDAGECSNYTVKMTFTLTDTETGYCQNYPWLGMAADQGDKALYKAYTSAVKYFLLKNFLLPTHDDVEHTAVSRRQLNRTVSVESPPVIPPMDPQNLRIMNSLEEHFRKLTPEGATFDRDRFHAAVWEYFRAWPSVNAAAKRIKEVMDIKEMVFWG